MVFEAGQKLPAGDRDDVQFEDGKDKVSNDQKANAFWYRYAWPT